MRIGIVGAGAVGGFLGTRLARAGATVSALARGATRDALATRGWRLEEEGALLTGPVAAVSDDPADLGPQDLVILAVPWTDALLGLVRLKGRVAGLYPDG